MAIRPPGDKQLASVADRYGLALGDGERALFEPFVSGLLGSWTAVEELYARTAPASPTDRSWRVPEPADNPLGAWYVTTSIQETRLRRPVPRQKARVHLRPC
jgi:amidase